MSETAAEERPETGVALESLLPTVYDELRRVARRHMRQERSGHTLQTTAVVHEAYMRLRELKMPLRDRKHLASIAATFMRRILLDHAKQRASQKRNNAIRPCSIGGFDPPSPGKPGLVALDDALNALSAFDPRKCRAVELSYFGGLTIIEIAEVLHVSHATVERDLKLARAWLCVELSGGPP